MDARTKIEILYQDALGDISDIIRKIEALQENISGTLPEQFKEAQDNIERLIGSLSKAGSAYRAELEAYTNTQGKKVQAQMEADLMRAKAQFEKDSANAIKEVLIGVEQTARETIQRDVSGPAAELIQAQKNGIWQTMLAGTISGMFVATCVIGMQYLFEKPTNSQTANNDLIMAYGRATAAAWDKLDKKAQNIIKQEAEKSK